MAAIVRRLSALSHDQTSLSNFQELVLAWLNLPESGEKAENRWSNNDDFSILREALAVPDTTLRDTLDTLVNQPGYEPAQRRVNAAAGTSTGSTSTSAPTSRWVILTLALSAVVLIGIFFVVPWDLPANASLVYHIVARLLELCSVGIGSLGVLCLIIGLVETDTDVIIGACAFVVLAVAALLGQIFFFPLVVTFLGQLVLIGLLVVSIVLILMDIGFSV